MSDEYKFRIRGLTPQTLPMRRLSEYMADLSVLLGSEESVHFVRLDEGSAVIVSQVESKDGPKVAERVRHVRDCTAPPDAMKAFQKIDLRLASDNARGELSEPEGGQVITFPGKDRSKPLDFDAFTQSGSLEGRVVRVGGRDETSHIILQDGDVTHTNLETTHELARELAAHYRGPNVRVHGNGRWKRLEDGGWQLIRFRINSFDVLDDAPLSDVVERLRGVPGNNWKELPDPFNEAWKLRKGDDKLN